MWYEFTAQNSETHHGWTTDPDVAEAVLQHLNRNREINRYQMLEMGPVSDEQDLQFSANPICHDMSTVQDFE